MSKACIGTIVAATIAIGALPAFAQEPAAGAADGARRKQQIVIMEGILVQAVKQGANGVAQQFRTTLQAAQGRGLQPARVEDMVHEGERRAGHRDEQCARHGITHGSRLSARLHIPNRRSSVQRAILDVNQNTLIAC